VFFKKNFENSFLNQSEQMEIELDLCPICLLPTANSSIRLKCSHSFHIRCINDFRSCRNSKWKSCSLCRQELSSEDIAYLISKENQCEICNQPFSIEKPLYNLSCGHYFHFLCLITKNKNQRCFICDREYPYGLVKDADYNYKVRVGLV